MSLDLPADFVPPTRLVEVFRKVPGVASRIFDYLRGSTDEDAMRVMEAYGKLAPAEKRAITIDHLIAALKIEPKKMFEIIAGEMFSQNAAVTNLIAATAGPAIMRKRVEFAKKEEGFQDARMVLQSVGAVPVPKNQVTHSYVNVVGNKIENKNTVVNVPSLEDVVRTVDNVIASIPESTSD